MAYRVAPLPTFGTSVWRGADGTIELPTGLVPGSPFVPSGGPRRDLDGIFGIAAANTDSPGRPIPGVPDWVPSHVGMGDARVCAMRAELAARQGLGQSEETLVALADAQTALAQAYATQDWANIPRLQELVDALGKDAAEEVRLGRLAPRTPAARVAAQPDPRTSWSDWYLESLAEVADERKRQVQGAAKAAGDWFDRWKWPIYGVGALAGLTLTAYLFGPAIRGASRRAGAAITPAKTDERLRNVWRGW
jgi:hypothetical protein